jgi:hypothetical protein
MAIFSLVLFGFLGCWIIERFREIHGFDIRPILGNFLQEYGFYLAIGGYTCVAGMVLFWSTIFGHDQKNDSYRFLSRLGIHEGKVWWSRMLPALLCYLPVLLCSLGYFFLYEFDMLMSWNDRETRFWEVASTVLSMSLVCWLIPVAVGAFVSISLRSQMVAIALTPAGVLTLLGWMYLGWVFFAASPFWTTLPICLALLLASRIRAGYWLRETCSWRSRIIPLVPVFITTLVILIALPFVRVYSVPYISWEQIDAYFDQAGSQMIRSPEKRKALLQYIAKHNAISPEYERLYDGLKGRWYELTDKDIKGCTFEELLLLDHVRQWNFLTQPIEYRDNNKKTTIYLTRFTPWESARIDRALRLQIVASLVTLGGLQDEKAKFIRNFCERQCEWRYDRSFFDMQIWRNPYWSLPSNIEERLCAWGLRTVSEAIDRWYDDHDRTLPESLDDLAGTPRYLDELPVHPFTGEPVEYHRNAPPPKEFIDQRVHYSYYHYTMSIHVLGASPEKKREWKQEQDDQRVFRKSGGTYLRLGRSVVVLIEEPEPTSEPRPEGREII